MERLSKPISLFLLAALLFVLPVRMHAQQKTEVVTGHVSDVAGIALIGASIVEEGTNNGVVTDINGDFTINVSSGNSTALVIAYIGMEGQRIVLGNRRKINITLQEEALDLEQVVVTGYGNISKSSYTGSAQALTANKVEARSISSIDGALRGNIAGALSSGSGQPGESASVLLRGFGSMNASNQPIYVIDGVIWDQVNMSGSDNISTNPLNSLNPNDVASLTVLKDAASASLYGSRGANGVVVITTKKGLTNEKLRISISTENGFAYMTGNPDITTGAEYADLWVEGQMNYLIQTQLAKESSTSVAARLVEQLRNMYADKGGYRYDGKTFYEWQKLAQSDFNDKYQMPNVNGGHTYYDYFCEDRDKLPSTDWYKEISRVAPFSKTSLTIRGGGSSLTYYAGLSYFNEQGTIINSQLERYSLRMKLNSDSKKQLVNWGINTYLSYAMQSGPNSGGGLYNSPQYAASNLPSVVSPYLEDGSYNFAFPDNLLNSSHNPVASAKLNINNRPSINANVIGNVKFNFTKWLNWNTQASVYYYGYRRHGYYDSRFGSGYSSEGQLTERDVHRTKLSGNSMLNINKEWRNRHSINAIVGVEMENLKYTYTSITGQGFGSDDVPYLSNASTVGSYTGAGYDYGIFSIISRADYSFLSRYILAASYRRDYSSMFAPEYRGGDFWSVSGAYDMSKERFMRKARKYVSALKFKASYGVNGTLPSDEYYYWQNLYSSDRYTGEIGAVSTYRNCPNLTWEQNNVWNVGLDGTFLKGRIDLSVEYYDRISSNLLQDVKVSSTSGYKSMLMNTDAGIHNTGIEITLGGTPISTKNWNWYLSLNVSKFKSVYYGLQNQYLDSYSRQIVANGLNVHTWYLRKFLYIDPETGLCMYENIDPDTGEAYASTSTSNCPYRYDYQGVPKIVGGLTSNLSWKNLKLDMLFAFGAGHYIYDRMGASIIANDGASNYSIAKSQLSRWTPDTPNAHNPIRVNNSSLVTRSTRYLYKGDYLKLKNIRLAYAFPSELLQKAKISSLSLYLQAENPWVLSYLGDYDPEMTTSGYRFADLYPTASTYTLGINISF